MIAQRLPKVDATNVPGGSRKLTTFGPWYVTCQITDDTEDTAESHHTQAPITTKAEGLRRVTGTTRVVDGVTGATSPAPTESHDLGPGGGVS